MARTEGPGNGVGAFLRPDAWRFLYDEANADPRIVYQEPRLPCGHRVEFRQLPRQDRPGMFADGAAYCPEGCPEN